MKGRISQVWACCLVFALTLFAGVTSRDCSAQEGNRANENPSQEEQQEANRPEQHDGSPGTQRSLLTVFSEIATLFIAFFVAWIAYQQYVINREKLRLDLFEKRFRVYQHARDFLSRISSRGAFENDDVAQFQINTAESVFLFPDTRIQTFLQEIRKRAIGLEYYNDAMRSPDRNERSKAAPNVLEIKKWLDARSDELQSLFSPYLRFKK